MIISELSKNVDAYKRSFYSQAASLQSGNIPAQASDVVYIVRLKKNEKEEPEKETPKDIIKKEIRKKR